MDVLTYQCPNCGAALTFNEATQHWGCKYCLSSFTLEDLEKDGSRSRKKRLLLLMPKKRWKNRNRGKCGNTPALNAVRTL